MSARPRNKSSVDFQCDVEERYQDRETPIESVEEDDGEVQPTEVSSVQSG